MNDGLVNRNALERKTNGKLTPGEHLLIRKGDIAYNMMRMWQGASGLAGKDGIVSPAYVVLAAGDGIDPRFASYWFKSARMIHLFWAYSYGITGDRLRLYYKDFAKIPVSIPAKPVQARIGRVLLTVDRVIERTEELIAVKRKLKKGFAQQLLTGQRRLPGFREPWRRVRLGHLVTMLFSSVDKKTHAAETSVRLCNYTDVYYSDWITPDMAFMRATASESEIENYSLKHWDVVITKDSESPEDIGKPAVVMQDMSDVICGYHLAILRPTDVYGPFLAQLLQLPHTRHQLYRIAKGVTRFGLGRLALAELNLLVPELDEQRRIAAVLGPCDREVALLENRLAVLHELKKGLMQKLLTGNVRTNRAPHS
jgi:type I restriction enzyme S subunit